MGGIKEDLQIKKTVSHAMNQDSGGDNIVSDFKDEKEEIRYVNQALMKCFKTVRLLMYERKVKR